MFQYISCCSLSEECAYKCIPLFSRFNTSHVVVYLMYKSLVREYKESFNTSHVVVYRETNAEIFGELEFQYISCCSLSSCRPFFDQSRLCFNTSHVVVYPIYPIQASVTDTFQYISCCSLSHKERVRIYRTQVFQYISCCSLSRQGAQ